MNTLPTILYLDNKYINSLDELKKYISTNLNEEQKKDLVASVRDEVLANWLIEGVGDSKEIGEGLFHVFDNKDKPIGDEEVIIDLANLLGVAPPPQKHYNFNEHLKFVECDFMESYKETIDNRMTIGGSTESDVLDLVLAMKRQKGAAKDNSTIQIMKGVDSLNLVFRFKILKPENDYVTFTFDFNLNKEYEKLNPDPRTLWLGHKKNSIKEVSQTIKVEGLPKESTLSVKYDNEEIACFKLDNSANTDQQAEAKEETYGRKGKKVNLVARIHSDNGYGFYDDEGNLVLKPEYEQLENVNYPDNGEFEYGFYYKAKTDDVKCLYYIDTKGYAFLGEVKDAIPLDENRIAVCRGDYGYYGIIDCNGSTILEDNKFGKISGVSGDGFMVCEVENGVEKLVNKEYEIVQNETNCERFFVNPKTTLVCGMVIDEQYSGCYERWSLLCGKKDVFNFEERVNINEELSQRTFVVQGYQGIIVIEYSSKSGKSKKAYLADVKEYPDYRGVTVNAIDVGVTKYWKGCFYMANDFYVLANNSYERVYLYNNKPRLSVMGFMLTKSDMYYQGNRQKSFDDAFVVFNEKSAFGLVYLRGTEIYYVNVLGPDNEKDDQKLIGYNNHYRISIIASFSYDGYTCVRYMATNNKGEFVHTIIIGSAGQIIKEDHMNRYQCLCGPLNDKYYYLKNHELYWMQDDAVEGTKLSDFFQAKELYPLGATGNFIVEMVAGGFQIIDGNGNKLGEPFAGFNFSQSSEIRNRLFDFILNSQYLPIKNAEGKCGLIDTNGKVIVPCLYGPDEVEDMNSIFKREGIVLF